MSRKKSVLIVIHSMELGGAQKSLVSFLKGLQAQGYDKDYDIDLLIAKPAGLFMDHLPAFARRLTPPAELLWLGTPRGDALLAHSPSLRGRFGKARWILSNRQRLTAKRLNDDQRLWRNWKALLRPLPGHYDVAIAYMNGFPNYYVIDKVRAKRKILWIHNEYEKLGYDASFDRPYYEAADGVVTISDVCRESFLRVFPGLSSKVSVLANITLAAEIRSKGALAEAPEFEQADGVKILSVGRVCVQKQFELAVRGHGHAVEQRAHPHHAAVVAHLVEFHPLRDIAFHPQQTVIDIAVVDHGQESARHRCHRRHRARPRFAHTHLSVTGHGAARQQAERHDPTRPLLHCLHLDIGFARCRG